MRSADAVTKITKIHKAHLGGLEQALDVRDRELNTMKRGDELQRRVTDGQSLYCHQDNFRR